MPTGAERDEQGAPQPDGQADGDADGEVEHCAASTGLLVTGVAELARGLHPDLADRIWTGSVMRWPPPRRFTYVTALEDQVPPNRLGDLVGRLLDVFVERGGRLIISAYANHDEVPRDLFGDLDACGHEPSGRILIERPQRGPLITAWLDKPSASSLREISAGDVENAVSAPSPG